MTLAEEIAIAILTKLQDDGPLRADARWKDPALMPKVAAIIDDHLKSTRQEFAKFCIWWADIIHREAKHLVASTSPFAPQDFWNCQHPVCLSLVGTIADLARELKTTPDAIATLP